MRKILVVVLVVGMIWAVSGCGASKASTPKQAVKNFKASMENGDKALFLASVDITPEQKPLFEDMFTLMNEGFVLEKAMEKQYGQGKGMEQGPSKDFAYDGIDDDACYKTEGDKCKFTAKKGKGADLIKKDGAWRVVPPDVPTGKEAEQFRKMATIMTKVFQDARKKIGQKDYTADKINKELNEEMMKAMAATMQEGKK